MLEQLGSIQWSSLPQPPWNVDGSVPDAIRALASCQSQRETLSAYHSFLFAVGNNHAGTYFPVVLSTVTFLFEVIAVGTDHSREATLDVLIDILCSFEPEPGFETDPSTGSAVKPALLSLVSLYRSRIDALACAGDSSQRVRRLAVQLLNALEPIRN